MAQTIRGIRAFLFDMDGTLVDSTPAVTAAWTAWALKHKLDPDQVLHVAHGRPARETVKALLPQGDVQAEGDWMLARELSETGVVALPGIKEWLNSLGSFPWGIVTSASIELALYRLQLAGLPRPSMLVTSDDVKRGKPDPECFLLGAQRLNVAPRDCLVWEDTPAGLTAGREAGMRLIGVKTTFPVDQLHAEGLIDNYLGLKFTNNNGLLDLYL